jgi:hypothetical protein
MVDSIRIAIKLSDKDADTVRLFTRMMNGQAGFKSYRMIVTKTVKLNNVTLQQRSNEHQLVIDCSIPVFLFGNNVAELKDSDVDIFCNRISEVLNTSYGLSLTPKDIMNAEVRQIHFGKNIILPDEMMMTAVLNYANRTDVRMNRSISSVKYQQGESFHIRTSSYDLTLYDKSAENRIKSLESQHALSSTHSILRIEMRLNNQRIIKRFCPDKSLTVAGLMNNLEARRAILAAFDIILRSHHYGDDSFNIAAAEDGDVANPGNFLASIGLNTLINEVGLAATKHLLNQKFGNHVWPRYKRLARKAEKPDAVSYVESEINKWEIIPP